MALTKWQPPVPRHAVDDDGKVVWLELYFDLIYVAALIQLGDQLSDDVTVSGVGHFAAMFALLWWTWTGTTAFMNRFAVDDITHRALVFAQMFAVGNLALVAVSPIADRSSWLVMAYVAARVPLLVMYLRVRTRTDAARRLSDLYLAAFTTSIGLWLVSLAAPEPGRYWLWGFGVAIEFAAPILAVRRADPPPTHEEHFRERYALFTIIVLGESFVKTLTELADHGLSLQTQVFGGLVFAIGAALWWTYFDDVADSLIRPTIASGQLIWVYGHLPLTMALTALGVASKKMVVIDTFEEAITTSYLWLLVAAVAMALIATAFLDAVTVSPHFAIDLRRRVGPRLVAAALVALVPVVLGFDPAVAVLAGIVGIVVAQIAVEVVLATVGDHALRRNVDTVVRERSGDCGDLREAVAPSPAAQVCPICTREGIRWVELRACLTCGDVGCCDDSPGRHATAHHRATGHPAVMTLEPGEDWAYCYDHDVTDPAWQVHASEPTES